MKKKPSTKRTNRKAKSATSEYGAEFDRIMARVERIEARLHREQPKFEKLHLLPDHDVAVRLARSEYKTLNPEPTRQHQILVRNVVRILGTKVNPQDGGALALTVLNDAIQATEDLAIRAGFFVGLARGIAWTGELAMLPPKMGSRKSSTENVRQREAR